MKKVRALLLCLAWTGAGCIQLPLIGGDTPPARPPAVKPVPAAPAAPVVADQVNETNAREKADILQKELEREAERH